MPEAQLELATAARVLDEKIRSRAARVGIVGLGYVGLPLAVEFAKAGFSVTGIDVSEAKTRRINAGDSYVGDIPNAKLGPLVQSGKLRATTDFSAVRQLDTIDICVPTPLRKTKDPDMSFIVSACQEIARHLHSGMLIILESTTYPGTTVELVLPMLEKQGLKVGRDFFLCFSPERVDRAIQNIRPPTFQKWSADARQPARKWGGCFTRRRSNGSCPSARRKWRSWSSCWRTLSA